MPKYTEKFEQEIGFKITGAELSKKQTKSVEQAFRDLEKVRISTAREMVKPDEVKRVEETKEIYENIIKDRSKSLKNDFKMVKNTVKARLAAARLANRQLARPTKGGIAGFFQTGTGKAKNMMSAFKGIGGSLKGMTKMGGMMTKTMSSLSGVMGALGISLGALTSIGAFVALLVAADKHVKEMNTSILNAVANTGELSELLGDVPDIEPEFNIKNIRHSMNNLFQDYRVGQEDAMNALKAFGEQGINVKSILGDTIKETKGFRMEGEYALDGIQTASIFAHQLGKDTASTAQMMAEWSATLGISVSSLKDDFTKLTKDAKTSGLGVNRFFAAVQNASAGLEMYGIRTTEVSDTLNKLGKVGTGSMEGTTDATKNLISAMSKVTKETAAYFARNAKGRKSIIDSIQNELKSSEKRLQGFQKGLTLQKVMNMTAEEQNKAFGDQASEVRMVAMRMNELQQSMKGIKAGKILEVQRAMKRLGPGELMKIYVEQAATALGKSPATFKFTDLTNEELMILEQTLGLSADNLDEMKRVAFGIESGHSSTLEGIKNMDETNKENLKDLYKKMDEQAKEAAKMKTPMTAAIGEATNAILTNLFDVIAPTMKVLKPFAKIILGFAKKVLQLLGHLLKNLGGVFGIPDVIGDIGEEMLRGLGGFSEEIAKEQAETDIQSLAEEIQKAKKKGATEQQIKQMKTSMRAAHNIYQKMLKGGIGEEEGQKAIGGILASTKKIEIPAQKIEVPKTETPTITPTVGTTAPSMAPSITKTAGTTNNIGGTKNINNTNNFYINGGNPEQTKQIVRKEIRDKELREKV